MTDILGEIGSPIPVPSDSGDVPPSGNSEPVSGDPTCIVCGKALSYAGRGRKPRYCSEHGRSQRSASPGRSTRVTADVDKAMAVLGSLYDATSVGLLLVSPNAAVTWRDGLPQLKDADILALQSDPDLCRSICKMGETSGKAMFVTAHIMAVIPTALELRRDLAERRARRQEEQYGNVPDDLSSMPPSNSGRSFPNSEMF